MLEIEVPVGTTEIVGVPVVISFNNVLNRPRGSFNLTWFVLNHPDKQKWCCGYFDQDNDEMRGALNDHIKNAEEQGFTRIDVLHLIGMAEEVCIELQNDVSVLKQWNIRSTHRWEFWSRDYIEFVRHRLEVLSSKRARRKA